MPHHSGQLVMLAGKIALTEGLLKQPRRGKRMDYTMYYSSGQDNYLAGDVVDYMLVHRKPTEPDAVKEWITQGDVGPVWTVCQILSASNT